MLGNSATLSRRCSACDTNYPNAAIYAQCPRGCGETWPTNDAPIPSKAADDIKKAYIAFAKYCELRDAEISMLESLFSVS